MTLSEIEAGLRELGLKNGDIVLLHSALSSLGRVDAGAEGLVNAFLGVIGQKGTLVVPAFASGIVPETLAGRDDAVCSIAPSANIAAVGARAEDICRDHWKNETAHGEGTPYLRVAEMDGYVCLMGVDQDRNTMLHSAEELLRLPYLKDRPPRELETPEGVVNTGWKFFPGPHRDFIGLDRLFRESGKMRMHRIGNAMVRLIKAKDLLEIAVAAGERDHAFVLCDNPNCADCVTQRADLRHALFGQESFTLVAASSLAGRYVPEMIENCQAAGIDHLELDMIQGKLVQSMPADKLASAVDDIRAGGIEVSGVRVAALSARLEQLFDRVVDVGISRVVMPLTMVAGDHLKLAAAKGIDLSFYNLAMDRQVASEILMELKAHNLTPNVTFNAVNFVRAGEKPFLQSFKGKLRHFVDQLDIEDCCFDAMPQTLARGNAEIKEIVSILRCSSFAGYMVLGAENRFCGNLLETAERFVKLLESM